MPCTGHACARRAFPCGVISPAPRRRHPRVQIPRSRRCSVTADSLIDDGRPEPRSQALQGSRLLDRALRSRIPASTPPWTRPSGFFPDSPKAADHESFMLFAAAEARDRRSMPVDLVVVLSPVMSEGDLLAASPTSRTGDSLFSVLQSGGAKKMQVPLGSDVAAIAAVSERQPKRATRERGTCLELKAASSPEPPRATARHRQACADSSRASRRSTGRASLFAFDTCASHRRPFIVSKRPRQASGWRVVLESARENVIIESASERS